MTIKTYLISLPERLVRCAVGLGAGVVREVGELVLPRGFRRTQLYRSLVDTTLRFLTEQVGGVERTNTDEDKLADNFLARRTAGNAIELLGIVAFRASPVWVLAALADVSGMGRQLIPEIADALKAEGLLDREAQFTSVDHILSGLERTSSRLASTINTPPLDVPTLREEWQALRAEAASIPPGNLPSREFVGNLWAQLKNESSQQGRSVFETSSMLALGAIGNVPERLRWLSSSSKLAARRTGEILGATLLDHYQQTLDELRHVGFVRCAKRQLLPYLRAAMTQFSPKHRTLTERLINRSF